MTSALLTLVLVPAVLAQTGRQTSFPSNLNSTSYITSTTGTYGGIFQADIFNGTLNVPVYGTCDYCFMPHPRAQEYTLPPPVANGSVSAKLVFLEYVQRHQRRTMYNVLPSGETQVFDCSNIEPYLYGSPEPELGDQLLVPVHAQVYTSTTNPLIPGYISGSCQYPQDLWAVYGDKLGFLPENPNEDTWFRVSNSPLTQQSAGGVIPGMWPGYNGTVPLMQQVSAVDTVGTGWSCAARSALQTQYMATDLWKAHINATAPLIKSLQWAIGNISAWQTTFDHLADNFQARLCNGYQLPCNPANLTQCVTMNQADEVFRAGDWEWNYYWRQNPNATAYIQSAEGLFIGEIVQRLQQVVHKNMTQRYVHVFAHDGDIGPIAGALGINALRWPAVASNLAFEIWQTNAPNNNLFARVLYSGQAIETIHGVMDWVPMQTLIDVLSP